MRYTVIIEHGEDSVGAYVPDLPGCVSVGDTEEEAITGIRESIAGYLAELRARGEAPPPATSSAVVVEVAFDPAAA